MNSVDSCYDEVLSVEKTRKRVRQSFIRFLHHDAYINKEIISKLIKDLHYRQDSLGINELSRILDVEAPDNKNESNEFDRFIASRCQNVPQTSIYVINTQIISLYGEMMLAKTSHEMDVLERMLELCMEERKKQISSAKISAEMEEKLVEAGKSLGEYLMLIKKMDRKSVLKYIEHLYDLRDYSLSTGSADYRHPKWVLEDRMLVLLTRFMLSENLFEMRRNETALTYIFFLCMNRDMKEDEALLYVEHMLDLRDSVELHHTSNDNNISVEDDKIDYPSPPSKGSYVPSSWKENSSDNPEVLHSCKLSSDIERARAFHIEQQEQASPLDKLKDLDENINSQINSLYSDILFAESIIEMDALSNKINRIIQKKNQTNDLLSMYANAVKID